MAVYQPNAIVGNSHVLVSLGARGEIMTFLYPHIDFPQNVHEGMPAVYFPAEGGGAGRLSWTFQEPWQGEQRYVGRTNIVETRLREGGSGLELRMVDFVYPGEPMLVRRFEVANRSSRPVQCTLLQYLDLQLGEVEHRNAVHYHPDRALAVAYWRNICFAVAVDSLEEFGCGRAGGEASSAKRQMEQGRLNKQMEEIGDIDLAVGWNLGLRPGEEVAHELVIAAGSNEPAAVGRVEKARGAGWQALYDETRQRWEAHLAGARAVQIEPDLQEAYYRCLLGLDLLADARTGSILAAPEFDPFFERSGGYGYCWPRDAVEVCLTLQAAGYPRYLSRFLAWARGTQRPEGYWEQRYWLNGDRGPSWCTHPEGLQVDQTASVLFAMGQHARQLRGQERLNFLEQTWESARRAAEQLRSWISPETGLHGTAFDLWETFRGTFTYSNGAIWAALGEAAFLAGEVGEEARAREWDEAAGRIREGLLSKLWLGEGFARGFDMEGRLDRSADSSVLGLVTPFRVLRVEEAEDGKLVRRLVEGLERRLGVKSDGGEAWYRFEGDQYAGAGPSAVSTLWLARVLLELAITGQGGGEAEAYRERAVACMRAALAGGTTTGLLPEMMGVAPGSHWAVPHAWAMASFAMAAMLLDRLGAGQGIGNQHRGELQDE